MAGVERSAFYRCLVIQDHFLWHSYPKGSKVKIEHLPYAEDVEDVCEEENFTVVDVGFGGLVVVVLVLFLFLFPVPY